MFGYCYRFKLAVTITWNGNDRFSVFGLDLLRITAIWELPVLFPVIDFFHSLNGHPSRLQASSPAPGHATVSETCSHPLLSWTGYTGHRTKCTTAGWSENMRNSLIGKRLRQKWCADGAKTKCDRGLHRLYKIWGLRANFGHWMLHISRKHVKTA